MRAFWDFPETCHLLPRERARRRVLPRYLGSDARDAAAFGTLQCVSDEGSVVGAAAWLPPHAYPVSLRRQAAEAFHLLPIVPWSIGALRKALKGQAANRDQHAGCPPHYWLRAIGVDPDRQGQGVGTLMMRSLLDRADADYRGCFLFTATEQNAHWYESFGFTVLSTYHPTPEWPQVWAMWRDATSDPNRP
jgi:GNAT superfamily N-acetyltransferase